jgi:hypothetical protein
VLDARRYEDSPGQGRLFVEPARQGEAANGEEHEKSNGARAGARDRESVPRRSRRAPAPS